MSELYNQAQENFYVDRGLTPLPQPHLTGMKLKADIVLGDFVFNTIDEFGVTWVITDIEGWWQHPEPDMPDIPRGFGDGSYDVKGRYQARILTLSGTFLTPTPDLVEAARDRLISATNLVYRGAWLKTGSDGKRASFVRLSGAPNIQTTTARGRTDFSIGLKAADPIKYSWNDQEPEGYNIVEIPAANRVSGSTGLETINNLGTVDVPVALEIQGPVVAPAYVVVNKNTATEKLLAVVGTLRGRLTSSIVNKQLSFDQINTDVPKDILTLTTRAAHGLLVNDIIEISGLAEESLNGEFTVASVPTETTLTIEIFDPTLSTVKAVVSKKLSAGVATIETATAHGYVTGNSIFIAGVDDVFNGTYTVVSAPTSTTFTFSKVRGTSRSVIGSILINNSATLTTADAHGFVLGDTVTVANVDLNYNGSFEVTSTPTPTTFSYTSTRTNSKSITTKALANDTATITTDVAHGLVVGESVTISGLDSTFDGSNKTILSSSSTQFTYRVSRESEVVVILRSRFGGQATFTTKDPHSLVVGEVVTLKGTIGGTGYPTSGVVVSVPSNSTFAIANAGQPDENAITTEGNSLTAHPSKRYITSKQLIGGVATINTFLAHGFLVGEQVTISGLGGSYDGTYSITSVPFANSFTYVKAASNESLSSAGPLIATRSRTGSLASITTSVAHGLSNNQYVTISGMDSAASTLNGNYVVTVTSTTAFTYTTAATGTIASAAPSGGTAAVFGSFATITGTIPSTADAGVLNASGNLPFVSLSGGTASIGGDVLSPSGGEIDSSGIAVKNANIPFTPGLTGATIDFGPDLLEIDTLSKDVALNGEFSGARAKLDVFTDFFFLQPGENTVEFYDSSSSSSNSLLKIYYRSGYLG